jgi:hypothetical protein
MECYSHLAGKLLGLNDVWVSVDSSGLTPKAISAARARVRQRSKSCGAQYAFIVRDSGIFVFATSPLIGHDIPTSFNPMHSDDAVHLLKAALVVPGVHSYGVSTSRGWTKPQPERRHQFERLEYSSYEDAVMALHAIGGYPGSLPPSGSSRQEHVNRFLAELHRFQGRDHDCSIEITIRPRGKKTMDKS